MKSEYHFKFEELTVYQRAIEFGEVVHTQVSKFPKIEDYRLSSQFARAADSIAFNIAEGSGSSDASFLNYLRIARDSSRESVAATTKAFLRGYITFEESEENRRILVEINKMLAALMKHLKNKNN
ncbi:four helix bundle protein [Marinirhabdus gelatinilytica]|uniref:Four helix bundle protein n=1 Tax=Marinirhabdus gelatinilytica TaxID=1703343 RepID=A0A370Q665_9FLAO|nr:four helix bundle protein [Marinirhabdus gelatinilytica]RDK83799.1 four helix bundle protein [Marinirhabdus gelatinilytica]